jgi:signal peptidase I
MEDTLLQVQNRRSEKAGVFHFMREMGSALVMALIAIIYVIQAFKIPTGSMEDSLLVGDFLLGLKFIYGAPIVPFSHDLGIKTRLPAVTNPKAGDVIIFKYPGADRKDYIKRCVAGPGSVLEIQGTRLIVDGKELKTPPRGKYLQDGRLDPRISTFKPLRIPRKGDVLKLTELDTREFVFAKHLIHQENPRARVKSAFQLYINGEFANSRDVTITDPYTGRQVQVTFENLKFDFADDWTTVDNLAAMVTSAFPEGEAQIRKVLVVDGKPVNEYRVQYDNYFMMGDNRDNSLDSRYWGYLNRNFVKAKAFILYFSLNKETPYWQLPLKIRWNRIGKLIRSWDGITPTKMN